MIIFYLIFSFTVAQRLAELYIANRNEQWMRARGGIEIGNDHYKWFVFLHILFFVFLISEVNFLYMESIVVFNIYFFIVFLIAQIGRVWCIISLGKFWNTKIIILPKVILIKKGPYKYVKHPNYIIVLIELLSIPSMFGAYKTAILFSVLHLILLSVRIPLEDRALGRRIQ